VPPTIQVKGDEQSVSTGGVADSPDVALRMRVEPTLRVSSVAAGLTTPPPVKLPSPVAAPAAKGRDALWIDKFLVKKQQQNEQAAVSLPVQRLLSLAPELHQQLKDLSATTVVPSGLIAALWRTLEANTRKHEHTWQFVETDGRFDYSDDLIPESMDTPDAVFGRFRDVLLVRNSALPDRVRSKDQGTRHFLHANHVDLGCGRRFIAGQKPVSGEIPGFQQMLIEQNVGVIVDLTRSREEQQAGVYIPEHKTKFIDADGCQVLVLCSEIKRLKNLTAVGQYFRMNNGKFINEVQRLHFLEWPDHGVIASDTLISLADEVDALGRDPKRAIFVHCMAGMGRTGTLISFLAARTRIRQELLTRNLSLNTEIVLRVAIEVVARGRLDRGPFFVQTEGQFGLLARALLKDFSREPSHGQ